MEDKQELSIAVDALIREKEGLIMKIRNLSRLAERQELTSDRSKSMTPQRDRPDEDSDGRRGLSRGKIQEGRGPMTVDIAVDNQPRVIRVAVGRPAQPLSTWRSRQSRNQLVDETVEKENQQKNFESEGRQLPPRVKKFIGAWTHVAELAENFEKLLASLHKLSSQVTKDKSRIEQLSVKKADLAPFAKEISTLLTGLQSESLAGNKQALEAAEADHLGRAVAFLEKLAEEYSYIYGNFSEKLKARKSDYIRWNKKLAAYCQQAYPAYAHF